MTSVCYQELEEMEMGRGQSLPRQSHNENGPLKGQGPSESMRTF